MLLEAKGIEESEYHTLVASLRFHTAVLLLPPWPEIYVQDDERDHTFEHCVRVHHSLVRLYTKQGFQLLVVPPGPVDARAADVLRMLTDLRG
jgi:predicted ATPase